MTPDRRTLKDAPRGAGLHDDQDNDKRIGDGMALGRAVRKLTAEVKTVIDDNTKDEFARLATNEGMTISEYLRDLVMIHVHGRERLARLHAQRLERMAGLCQVDGE